MDLRTYLAAIRKSWLLTVIMTILGTAAGTFAYVVTAPTYATTIDFYVSTPSEEGTNPQAAGQFGEARVNSYIVLLSSEQMARRIIDSTGLDMTPQQVARKVEASTELNTVMVNVIVTDDSPQRSLLIARGLASTFPRLVDELDNQGRDTDIVAIHVVSGPTVKINPISPDPKIYIGLGLLGGLVLGLVIAIVREVLDNSVRSVESAQRLIGAPVIGTILYDSDTKRSPLIVGDEATSLRSEAYRQLRTNLQFINAAHSANTIMLTSSIPLEGKSTTAVNLALTLVEFGERVLLIDADLRRPRLSQLLGLNEGVGLTNVLAGQVELDAVIQPWGAGRLSLLASGSTPPNPSELLGSTRMAELISGVQQRFDKIIIDTPPVLPVTDAAVVSAYAEAVVVVVRHGRTSRAQVANAASTLENVDARVVGSVLNMKKSNRSERRRYGHQGYYFGQGGYGSRMPTKRSASTSGQPEDPQLEQESDETLPVDGTGVVASEDETLPVAGAGAMEPVSSASFEENAWVLYDGNGAQPAEKQPASSPKK
jgi:capsular exopolysaccharide synthesis family protein